jgi:hypothetical protein
MEFNTSFHGTSSPEQGLVSLSACLDRHEARILRPLDGKLNVDLSEMRTPLDLFSASKVKLSSGDKMSLAFSLIGNPNASDASQPKWELGSIFTYTTFNLIDLRKMFVLVKNIANEIENAYILQAPMSPQQGFQRTWSTNIDLPKGFLDAGFTHRAISIRQRTHKDG